MTAQLTRQYWDGSKPDTPNGINVANLLQGLGNAWDCVQSLGIGVWSITSGVANLTQANAGLNLVDASAGNVTINLPASNTAIGALFQFKRVDNVPANTVTINRAGADTIDGATSVSLTSQYEYEEMRADGTSAYRRLNTLANALRARQQLGVDAPYGQCQLTLSAGVLKLSPFNGNKLTVNGVPCTVPDAGMTLAAAGLGVGTLYYIYATQANGAINALEASATAYAVDTGANNKGVRIKNGDAARTLVGMARPIAGPAFADTVAQRFVRSWFNEQGVTGGVALSATTAFTSAAFAEITSAPRAEVLTWAGEQLHVAGGYSAYDAGAGTPVMAAGVGIDGTGLQGRAGNLIPNGANQSAGSYGAVITPAEGYHFLQQLAQTSGGSAPTWMASYTGMHYVTSKR